MKKTDGIHCPECEKRDLETHIVELSGKTHDEEFVINTAALVCPNCGFKTIPKELMGQFGLRISDAYREKHGLLTSSEIKDKRLNLGMSQSQFASYLGVGIASVKRWELGQIQDVAMNTLMVLKTDLGAAQQNVSEISIRMGTPSFHPNDFVQSIGEMVQHLHGGSAAALTSRGLGPHSRDFSQATAKEFTLDDMAMAA